MFRTGNPALREKVFTDEVSKGAPGLRSGQVAAKMTIRGTVNKTFIMLGLTVLTAMWTWSNPSLIVLVLPAAIIGLVVAIVTIFKKELSPITAPVYSAVEGVVLGGISAMFEAKYPGIVFQAVVLTFGTLFCLLAAYKSGLIKATENFKLGVIAATGAVAVIYIISIVLSFFGINMPMIHSSGPVGIIFSIVVVIIAALNLVLDFDFIETGEKVGAPKYMEWYGAFGLMVTLIWLYLEILRLLGKIRSR